MLSILCITLPCAVSIVFVVLFLLRKRKSVTDKILLALSICSAIYFFAEANYITIYEDYKTLVLADIASQFARPLIAPLMVLCIHSMTKRLIWRWWMTVAFTLAIIIGSVSFCVYMIMGIDNAVNYVDKLYRLDGDVDVYESRIYWLYEVFCIWLYRITNVVYAMIGIGRIAYLFRVTGFRMKELPDFMFRRGEIEPAFLMSILYIIILFTIFIKLSIGRYYFVDHQCLASVFCLSRTILLFLVGHVGLRNNNPTMSMSLLRYNYNEADNEDDVVSVNYADMAAEEEINISNFNDIRDKKLFLNSHISIEQCANMLGTNRTYLSRYVSMNYGSTFREYINFLRIEYSKQYMLEHNNEKQEVIAEACGFCDAPSFNKKFKQIVGKTPRMWMAS